MKHTAPQQLIDYCKFHCWSAEDTQAAIESFEQNGFYTLPGGSGWGEAKQSIPQAQEAPVTDPKKKK